VIDEALRLVEQRYQAGGGAGQSDRTGEQLANLKRLGEKLDAMPAAPMIDGLGNRDHDRILYSKSRQSSWIPGHRLPAWSRPIPIIPRPASGLNRTPILSSPPTMSSMNC
jgi:hypothetical protein